MASFSNSATLSYNGIVLTSNTATGEIVEVLSLSKTAVGDSYSPGGTVTYAVSIRNTGETAMTGLTLTDNLGAYSFGDGTLVPLTYLPDTLQLLVNGEVQAAPTVEAGPPLVVSGISVPAGGSAVLLYKADVNQYADPQVGGTITNTASLQSLTAEETVTAEEGPILSITKSADPTVVPAGGTLTYTFEIQNSGNAATQASDNVVLSDLVSPILYDVTVTYNGAPWTEGVQYTYDEATGAFVTTAGAIVVPAATYSQDTATGAWSVNPGTVQVTISGSLVP